MDPFGLRPATLDDVDAMSANAAEGVGSYAAWAPTGWAPPPDVADPARLRERWRTPGFAAHVNANVSAHVASFPAEDEPGAQHLYHLFARAHRQGTGVAAALLSRAIADARRGGATVMRLRTPHANARGVAFYQREGFAVTGAAEDTPMPGISLVWMRRPL